MIKRLLLATLLALSTTAFAAERITLIWGFSPAANQANFYRAMVAELNRNQTKYEFFFETKTGAGGSVAARHVLENPKNTLLGGTSTFFIRPNFDRETGYAAESFQPVLVQTLGAPVAFFSSKYNNIKVLKKDQDLTTSISGYGSHSNLMGSILGEHYSGVRIINYVSLVDAVKDVQGKHIDTGWNWLSEIEGLVNANATSVLGLTGTRSVNGFPTLASQGIKGFENASTNTAVVASAEMPIEKVRELYELLRVANRAPDVQAGYAREYSTPADFTWPQTITWFNQQVKFWREQAAKVKPLQ
jgi:tripartite-type tricarboxylate transporter receptor subunit TctC